MSDHDNSKNHDEKPAGEQKKPSEDKYKTAPWEKEIDRMEDKKNVSFVSGLALLLSVLALVLIGWGGVADNPRQQEEKDLLANRIDSIRDRVTGVEEELAAQAKYLEQSKKVWQIYQLQELEAQLGSLAISGDQQYKADVNALKGSVNALIAKIEGKPAAPVAAPAADVKAPADVKKEIMGMGKGKGDKKMGLMKKHEMKKDKKMAKHHKDNKPCDKPCPLTEKKEKAEKK